ncbi:MAG: hypothetical protein IPM16_23415 [Chloroflexi bacterium]|nr:hypothetical protein [Chloroflexota bacterium]
MTAFEDALEALASLDVAGVAHRFGMEALPGPVDPALLPALMIQLADPRDRLFPHSSGGFDVLPFEGGPARYSVSVRHHLLVAVSGAAANPQPKLAQMIDAYFAALEADPMLGGALALPARVQVEIGEVRQGAGRFVGAVFRHVWALEVE